MALSEGDEGLSNFERAVVYYTLPRVTGPVTIGLIVAYCLCLAEAIAALTFGLVRQDPVWTRWGTVCLAGIIIFGTVAFLVRAFLNDVRARALMTAAHRVKDRRSGIRRKGSPDVGTTVNIPDPFANHVLLRFNVRDRGRVSKITDKSDQVVYTVAHGPRGRSCSIVDNRGVEVADVRASSSGQSFVLHVGRPTRLTVRQGEEDVATVSAQFSFSLPVAQIECEVPEPQHFTVRGGSIMNSGRLIGRIYQIRGYVYLDIEEREVNPGVLAYYAMMS